VGIQDRRANGGAVSLFSVNRWRGLVPVFLAISAIFLLASCSRNQPAPPDPSSVLQAVTPADPAKLPSLDMSKHWSNPYLVIHTQAVGLLTDVTANEEQQIKPEDVLKTLAQLPPAAWPYGRAVAILVDAKPTSSEEEKAALRRNRGIVAGELQSAHVVISWISRS
jgi:hypothetical protein